MAWPAFLVCRGVRGLRRARVSAPVALDRLTEVRGARGRGGCPASEDAACRGAAGRRAARPPRAPGRRTACSACVSAYEFETP
jgi:hypothetical protein